jgi:uncharacterized protein (TIGR02145 family)
MFVDYNDAGVMKRLLVAGATVSAGTVTKISGNDKGVWVAGNARTNDSFSAKVELFTEIKDIAGACAYASNYPPVGEYISASEILFIGTPEYKVVLERSDKSTYTATVDKDESLSIPNDEAVLSFTDKTGAPGVLVPATYILSGADGCAEATVTLTLSGSQKGWKYQLHKGGMAVGSVMDGTGNALPFPDAPTDGNFNYTVWTVDNSAVKAQRAMQVSNVRTITVNPLPTVTSSAGAARCGGGTLTLTAMPSEDAVIDWYDAASSGTLLLSGNNIYTTLSINTNTTYYAQARNSTANCLSTSRIAVEATIVACPPGAASTQTWVVDSQTWSAPLMKMQAGCAETTDLGTTNPPTVAYYRSNGLYRGSGYLYNRKCVNDYATQLCPSPWRVPTREDFINLDLAFGGDGSSRDEDPSYVLTNYVIAWGVAFSGLAYGTTLEYVGTNAYYWSADALSLYNAYYLRFTTGGNVSPVSLNNHLYGFQVRCVK